MSTDINNILDVLEKIGEEDLKGLLASFSCPRNAEIEKFLKDRALDFARRRLSITYIVTDAEDGEILGYFTLGHKAIAVDGSAFSRTMQRKLDRWARRDGQTGDHMASAFLLAQLGKNYDVDEGRRIDGASLMRIAHDVLIDIQRRIGGGIVYLDCEDDARLLAFYDRMGFRRFGERSSEEDGLRYVQLIRVL